jgi:hypothetical protein
MGTSDAHRSELPTIGLDLSPNEASGLLVLRDRGLLDAHGWERAFWVVLDEGPVEHCVAAVGHRRDAPLDQGWEIERLSAAPSGDSGKTEDAEALARHDGWVYVFGSHFGSKDGPLQPKRHFVARFREDAVRHLSEDPAVDVQVRRRSFVLHRVVNDALQAMGPPLTPLGPRSREAFVTATRHRGVDKAKRWDGLVHGDDLPLNVEGAAFRTDGSLLLGLRYPVAADGRPLLVDLDGVDRLFEQDETPEVRGFWLLDAIGRDGEMAGVRDLDLAGDELHVVTGNIDAREKGSILLEDHPGGRDTVSTHWRCLLPAGQRGGELAASALREFPTFPRIEGIAVHDDGRVYYVSDEDERVLVRHTHLFLGQPSA